jgi:hypothetical protein
MLQPTQRYRTYCFSLSNLTHGYLKRRCVALGMTQSEFLRALIRADLTQPLPPHPDSPWHRHLPRSRELRAKS